jgi:hypothetical protein
VTEHELERPLAPGYETQDAEWFRSCPNRTRAIVATVSRQSRRQPTVWRSGSSVGTPARCTVGVTAWSIVSTMSKQSPRSRRPASLGAGPCGPACQFPPFGGRFTEVTPASMLENRELPDVRHSMNAATEVEDAPKLDGLRLAVSVDGLLVVVRTQVRTGFENLLVME